MSKPPPFVDLGDFDEDQRIETIGRTVMSLAKTVAVVVEAKPGGKADRYVKKLKDKFPGIVLVARFNGPLKGTVTLKLGPPSPVGN